MIDVKLLFEPLVKTPYLAAVDNKPLFLSKKLFRLNEVLKGSARRMSGDIGVLFCLYSTDGVGGVIKAVGSEGHVLLLPKLSDKGGKDVLQPYFSGYEGLAERLYEQVKNIPKKTKREKFVYSKDFLKLFEKYYVIFRNITDEHKIKAFFLTGLVGLYESALLQLSLEKNIPVFCCQHGFYNELYPDKSLLRNVIFFASGNEEKKTLLRYGISKKNVFVTGSPFFDDIAKYRKIDAPEAHEKTITILTQPMVEDGDMTGEDYFAFIESLLQKISVIQKCKLIVKMHPRERYKTKYESIIDSLGIKNAEVVQESGKNRLYAILSKSDLVIGFESTAEIEALILGKDVLTIDLRENSTAYDYKQNIVWVKHGEIGSKLTTAFISKILGDNKIHELMEKKRNEYVKRAFFSIEGKSYQTVADIIERTLHEKTTI
jgi:polyhydroxyalkanoate synthesis regulator phasin